MLLAAGLLTSGCSLADLPRYGWPESVTPQGARMQHFWSAAFTASLVVGVLVWGLMFWCFTMYRKKKNSPLYPKQTKENLPLEFVYTVVPFVLVSILFYFTVTTENYVQHKVSNPDVQVNVTAFKWNWDFGYEGTKAPGGGDVHTIGTSTEIPILVLPVNKTIQYTLASKDVVHSFWVPVFDFKRDVFPYPEKNQTDNVFQNTIDRTGAWVGRCAELCGTYHSAMNFEVRAVPLDIYNDYLHWRATANSTTGAGYTVAEAFTQVAKDHPECGQLCAPRATSTYPLTTDRQAKSASLPPAGDN